MIPFMQDGENLLPTASGNGPGGFDRRKIILAVILFSVVAVAIWWMWFRPVQTVTTMSQTRAETPSGIADAAMAAKFRLQDAQLAEAAAQIAALKNQPPVYVVQTPAGQVQQVAEQERQRAGADFSILTDPKQPDKKYTFDDFKAMPAGTTVNLNQYNVQAYKKVLRQVDIIPDWSSTIQGRPKIEEASFSVSRRVSNDGKYLGIVAGYNVPDKKAKVGIRYTW